MCARGGFLSFVDFEFASFFVHVFSLVALSARARRVSYHIIMTFGLFLMVLIGLELLESPGARPKRVDPAVYPMRISPAYR